MLSAYFFSYLAMVNEITIFALLDAARMGPAMEQAQLLNDDFTSLYKGRSEALLAPFAPHLFSFTSESDLSRWFFAQGWGEAWGVFLASPAPPDELVRHFRRFLKVGLEGGNPFYLRFYDPRVLRAFLPTCDALQLRLFFGPVDYFWLEDEDPAYGAYFWLDETATLITHRVSRAELAHYFC